VSEPLIAIRELRYRYAGTSEDVLRIPSLDVSGSGLIAITGPSGAGKTTLVELLAGTLHEPYEGTVRVLGTDWKELHRDADRQRQLRRIGLIPQDFGLLPSWTPERTLQQDLSDAQMPFGQREARVRASLTQVGLNEFAGRAIGALSGGQRQRVAIARMLARDVELVIADEPTANLDPELVTEIGGLFKELARKVPVVVVTHDPRMAEICDRTIVLQAAAPQPAQQTAREPSRHRSKRGLLIAAIVAALILSAGAAAVVFTRDHGRHGSAKTTATHTSPSPTPTPTVPPPDLAAVVPANYRVSKVMPSSIDQGQVPIDVVVSVGPVEQSFGSTPNDLQILVWDSLAGRWNITFDARKVAAPEDLSSFDTTNDWPLYPLGTGTSQQLTLLPSGYEDDVTQVRFVDLGPPAGNVVLFMAGVSAGMNNPVELAIVGFSEGQAQVDYFWGGDCNQFNPLVRVLGQPNAQMVRVTAPLGSPVDSMATDPRPYHFLLRATAQGIEEVKDDRPWLGATVQAANSSLTSPLVVQQVVPGSPADGHLQPGDVIVSVNGQAPPSNANTTGPVLVDQVERLYAGSKAALGVERGGSFLQVRVRLGSLMDQSARDANPPSSYSSITF
jgi:putative ABC transport system ATP-binding protein